MCSHLASSELGFGESRSAIDPPWVFSPRASGAGDGEVRSTRSAPLPWPRRFPRPGFGASRAGMRGGMAAGGWERMADSSGSSGGAWRLERDPS